MQNRNRRSISSLYGIVFAIIALLSLNAYSEDWYFITQGQNGDSIFVDVSQLKSTGNRVSVWMKTDLKKPVYIGLFKPRIAQYLDNANYDCALKRFALSTRYSRDANGTVVTSEVIPDNKISFSNIVPGSIGSSIVNFVCGRGKDLADPSQALTPDTPTKYSWHQVGETNDGKKIYVSADKIVNGTEDLKGQVFYYQKSVDSNPSEFGLMHIETVVTLVASNCSNRDFRTIASASFGAGGELLFRNEPFPAPQGFRPNANTIGEATVDYACSNAPTQIVEPPKKSSTDTDSKSSKEAPKPANSFYSGTSWYVDSGYFVTAEHVVHGASEIYIMGPDKNPLKAEVVAADAKNDVAILSASLGNLKPQPLILSRLPANLGARVFTIGYPHMDLLGVSPKITSGEVSGTLPLDPTKILISVPLQSGNSGGPLINMNGEVVGLVIEKLQAAKMLESTGDLTENVNFALKAKYIDALLDDLPNRPGVTTPRKTKPSSVEEIVASYKDSIYLVLTRVSNDSKSAPSH